MARKKYLLVVSLCLILLSVAIYSYTQHQKITQLPLGFPHIESIKFNNNSFTVVQVDLTQTKLQLFWRNSQGTGLRNFQALADQLTAQGERLLVATNAGIFAPDYTPVGLHIERGKLLAPLNLADGTGNFFLKPNGVLLVSATGAEILESSEVKDLKDVQEATQSGPLLVIKGQIPDHFPPNSTNKFIRSGVGVKSATELYLAISEEPVNFYNFAALFKDRLGCREALYLDGAISKLYIPRLNRRDDGEFTGMLAITPR